MEPKFQTSFIPKKPIVGTQVSGASLVRNTNVFSVVATVVFLVAVITSGALFVYKNVLTGQIADADSQINVARAAFQPEKIQELVDANSKITAAATLLNNHILVSKMLLLLQDLTVKKLRFNDLTYVNKNNSPTVTISGEVQSYNALADQQDVFLKNEFIKSPTFSNFVLGDNGYITVDFSARLDPSLLSYKNSVGSTP